MSIYTTKEAIRSLLDAMTEQAEAAQERVSEHVQNLDSRISELERENERLKSQMLIRIRPESMATLRTVIVYWMAHEDSRFINAIKFVREVTNMDLKSAKDFVDSCRVPKGE